MAIVTRARTVTVLALLWGVAASNALADAPGGVEVTLRRNGSSDCSGTFEVRDDEGHVVAGSPAGRPVRVPAGAYVVAVALDGVLDRPVVTQPVTVRAGRTARVQASFSTGTVTVTVTHGAARAVAMVDIRRGDQTVAALASGVRGTLSAGAWQLHVRLRGQERTVTVELAEGADEHVTIEL